jgi:N-acyl-D-amino-acid deacylase
MKNILLLFVIITLFNSCKQKQSFETIIRNGMIYDGSGGEPYQADLAINADTIAFIGDLKNASAKNETDATGLAVAPGFINMLSHAEETLIQDGRSQGDLRQGVTLEVFGEYSMGPLNPKMKKQAQDGQSNIKYNVSWNTLGGYLDWLEKKGVSCNIASFVGTGTIRKYVIGEANVAPTPSQSDSMRVLVGQAMEEGAMGISNMLIYAPDFFAKTDELIPLAKEASKYGGMYTSHIRSEGNQLFEGVQELISISKQADIPAEIYHLKESGEGNWWKIDSLIKMVEQARKEGLQITANMYTYNKSATGLLSVFPPALRDGGFDLAWKRLQNNTIREEMKKAMNTNARDWENMYFLSGGAKGMLLVGFRQDSLRKYLGKTLAEVATIRGRSPEETAMDLIVNDSSRVSVVYSNMNEDNIRREIGLPWLSFGSDAGSMAPEGVFLFTSAHPRAYGTFARVIGKYVRDEKVLSLQKAIYKLSKLPATNLKLQRRGELKTGNYADVVVFDPKTVQDHASFEKPQQYSTGVADVFVNGMEVLKNGEHTGATPGRFIKGPGYKKNLAK